jgi:hypothetical protein
VGKGTQVMHCPEVSHLWCKEGQSGTAQASRKECTQLWVMVILSPANFHPFFCVFKAKSKTYLNHCWLEELRKLHWVPTKELTVGLHSLESLWG